VYFGEVLCDACIVAMSAKLKIIAVVRECQAIVLDLEVWNTNGTLLISRGECLKFSVLFCGLGAFKLMKSRWEVYFQDAGNDTIQTRCT